MARRRQYKALVIVPPVQGSNSWTIVTNVTLDQWFSPIVQPHNPKKKGRQYHISDPIPDISTFYSGVFSQGAVNIPVNKLFQYKSLFEPLRSIAVVESLTVDKWFQPIVQKPPRAKKRPDGSIVEGFIPPASQVRLDSWFQSTQVPVRKGRRVLDTHRGFIFIPVSTEGEITLDKWFSPTVQPHNPPKRGRQFHISDPIPDITTFFAGVFSQGAVMIPVNKLFQYQSRFEPLRTIVVIEEATLDKWFQPTQQRLNRVKRQQYLYPTSTAPISPTVPGVIFTVSQPLNRAKRLQYLYPSLFRSDFPIVAQVPVNLDRWFSSNNQPYFARKNNGHLYPMWSMDKLFFVNDTGLILGWDNDTNIKVGRRRTAEIGYDNDTGTMVGRRRTAEIGRDNDTYTGIGKKLP